MKRVSGSKRTQVLFWLYLVVGLIGVAAVLGLLISLGGALLFGWEGAPVDPISIIMIYAAILMVALRLSLMWSVRRDKS